jgi:hypothetical protein
MVMRSFALSSDEGRKIAEKGAATIRNVVDKGEEVADQARRASEENYLIANEALRQFNLKFLELAHENSERWTCAAAERSTGDAGCTRIGRSEGSP